MTKQLFAYYVVGQCLAQRPHSTSCRKPRQREVSSIGTPTIDKNRLMNTDLESSTLIFFSRRTILTVVCALLIFLFLYTGVSKYLNFITFAEDMKNQPFPQWMTFLLIWVLPAIEIMLGLGLMFNKSRLISLYGSFILMLLFTVYVALILLNVFDKIPCSCGGVLQSLGWNEHLIFNFCFLAISCIGCLLGRKELRYRQRSS